jgi:hypothetical protein
MNIPASGGFWKVTEPMQSPGTLPSNDYDHGRETPLMEIGELRTFREGTSGLQ